MIGCKSRQPHPLSNNSQSHQYMSQNALVPQNIEKYGRHYDDHSLLSKLKSVAAKAGRKVVYNVLLLYYMLTDAHIPLKHKRLIVGVLGYFILPIDLIPDFLPGTGFVDDLLALLYVVKVLHDCITPEIKAKAESKCNEYLHTNPSSPTATTKG